MGRFVYPNKFGNNIYQNVGIGLGRRLSRNTGISGGVGVVQFDSEYIGVIQLDPDLASSLGVSAVTSVANSRRRTLSGGLTAYYTADLATFRLNAMRGMVPGNGILYGGLRDMVSFSVSRDLASAKCFVGLNGSVTRLSGVLQSDVQVRYQAAGAFGYRLGRGMFLSVNGGLRWQRLNQNGPMFSQKYVTANIGWTPEERSLPF
jgi:hypothetical protein